jgi:hypothetical protein
MEILPENQLPKSYAAEYKKQMAALEAQLEVEIRDGLKT